MSEFNFIFKEYSEEESRIYEKAIKEIMENFKNGMPFQDAVDKVELEDQQLKALIEDDALKILIAELAYVAKIPFEELAEILKLPIERIRTANLEMLEDVQLTLDNTFNKNRRGNA